MVQHRCRPSPARKHGSLLCQPAATDCAHGPAFPDPRPYVQDLLDRRLAREREIETAVRDGLSDPYEIAASLYQKVNPVLRRAAERNVLSHLSKLVEEGRVKKDGAEGYSLA